MSTLTDQIVKVLQQHYAVPHGTYYWRCAYPCDWKYGERDEHAVHVAELIVETLHLEQTLVKEGEVPPLYAIEGWIRGPATSIEQSAP